LSLPTTNVSFGNSS
jgi:cytochrome c oxidase assembly protein subunit 19